MFKYTTVVTGSKAIYTPLQEDDPKVRQPDITKAKNILGWEPKVKREEGLRIKDEYFINRLKNQNHSFKNSTTPISANMTTS